MFRDGNRQPGTVPEDGFAVRLAMFYGAIFAVLGVYLPYLPVWLDWRGLSASEIGLITAAPLFARVIATPLITLHADRRGDHRETIRIGAAAGFIAALALSFCGTFWSILLLVVVFQIAQQSILPLTEAIAMAGVKSRGLDYGRVRLWGSLSFIAANLLGGAVLARYGGVSVMVLIVMAAAATAGAALILTGPSQAEPVAMRAPPTLSDMLRLARQPWFLALMAASGLIQGSHAVYYAFSALHWRELGIADAWLGGLWAIGVLAEVALFAWSSAVLARTGAVAMIVLGGAAAVLRWVLMAFDPSFALLLGLQLLHALTFGATFLGTLHLLHRTVPVGQAGSAQGLHAALAPGIIMGAITVLAGQLYAPLKGYSFMVMAGLAAVGTCSALLLPYLLGRRARSEV
ncbi:MAG: MFS transporter [Hyphomicrobiaceae bacterium]|nr:MFS transporter [Hyphomicrobiaceae bacterium]